MAETKFEKDKERKDIIKHFVSVLVALIIALTGGLVSLIVGNVNNLESINNIIFIGGGLLSIFIIAFMKFAISLYKLIKKFE
jgi:uncharacterized membrane protein YbhN (UPF0104 family)